MLNIDEIKKLSDAEVKELNNKLEKKLIRTWTINFVVSVVAFLAIDRYFKTRKNR
jgi:hypothetical protein